MAEESETRKEMKAEEEELDKQMAELEENPPEKLEDWPDGKAKYRTFGGAESESGYDEGATAKLGPSEVRYYEDGNVTVGGEEVDNPDDYKGEPIPGGPTDPDAPDDPGMVRNKAEEATDDEEDEKKSGEDDDEDDKKD